MKKLVPVSFVFLLLIACSSVPRPTSTEIPTFTAVPTQTATAIQILTLLPASGTPDDVSEPLSEGQPASEWNGIPIMPGAIAGEGDEEGYVFTIPATPQLVQEYYQLELGKRGWQLFSQEDDDSSMILIFSSSASESLTINVIAKDGDVLVLLVK